MGEVRLELQPFVRKRDVKDGSDDDLTREPEMVQAYRDTWELGVHSYLTYLRDRLLVARDLLAPRKHFRPDLRRECAPRQRVVRRRLRQRKRFAYDCLSEDHGSGKPHRYVDAVPQTYDFLLWYCRDRSRVRLNRVFLPRVNANDPNFRYVEEPSGERRTVRPDEDPAALPPGFRLFRGNPLTSQTGGRPPNSQCMWMGKSIDQERRLEDER